MDSAGETCVVQGLDPRLGTCVCQATLVPCRSSTVPLTRALLKGPLHLEHATDV